MADFPQRLFYRTVAIREGHLVSFSQIRFGDNVVDFLSGDAGAPSKEVAAAMADLKEIEEEARALGYRVPEQCAIENATHVLSSLKLPPRHPPRLTVYPFANGDVGVDAASAHTNECRVLVICAGDGSVLCLVNLKKPFRRLWCANAEDENLGVFVDAAMRELADCRG